ncbi:MAG: type II toxin-antitoxin system death-on-curing family toxin [Candidatus Alcyoniella australis]|nr:type II toxin-antitoxin system death-on-curing family toxin [Candidatus Alcyoniella australis]
MNPEFLDLEDALEIHTLQLSRFGGSTGLRDRGLLESALAQPQAVFESAFLHADIFEMAAAYLFHIVRNHPFVDGNKRTGLLCALVFLEINGVQVSAEESEYERLTLATAEGQMDKPTLAEFFRTHSRQ